MAKISNKAVQMPASAIRKLVPLADKAKKEGVKVYHLNIGQPDIKSPDCALEAIRNFSLKNVSYSNSAGLIELREGLVNKYYKKIGIDIEVSELLVTVAGSESVNLALEIACNPGDEVIVLEPFYTNYNTFAFMNGITLKAIPTDIRNGFQVPPVEEFEKAITDRTKAILVCNPGNPCGTLYSKENMLALGDIARKHNLFLISDEVYREFCYTDEPHFSALHIPDLDQNIILVDSVSKRYNLCGARIGCIVSHNKEVMAAALKFAQARLCPPVIGQIAAIGALDTPDEYFAQVRDEYIRRRNFMIERLNQIEGVFTPLPMGAFYTIAELPVDNTESFARWMLEEFRV
ncbi:MAG: pyridoxal phosphate-dependent aminotransferase, partial [Bacteroidales bacterium]|nr:pyridoxal phosphate-dependent aminotransferase [Bacteroidales bacterium]